MHEGLEVQDHTGAPGWDDSAPNAGVYRSDMFRMPDDMTWLRLIVIEWNEDDVGGTFCGEINIFVRSSPACAWAWQSLYGSRVTQKIYDVHVSIG